MTNQIQKLTETQFLALNFEPTKAELCEHELDDHIVDTDANGQDIIEYSSYCLGKISVKCGDIDLAFDWSASGGNDSYQDAFEFEVEVDQNDPQFFLEGIVLVDEDGDEMDESDCKDVFYKLLDKISWEHEVRKILPEPEVEQIDINDNDEDTAMEKFIVERDNDKNIEFIGELIGSASSSAETCRSDYSGSVGRWTELALYHTKSGKYICQEIGRTQHQGEHTRHSAAICETMEQVTEFFGDGWLAKELYEEADIENNEVVE